MSLELRATDASAITALWKAWEADKDSEIEATFKSMDYTNFLNVIKYLRQLGLKEEPEPPKLNIMVEGGLRFTLVGEGVIQAYCRDNTLKGKPFHVILKEKKITGSGGPSEVDLNEYGVRIKIRRESPLSKDYPRVVSALSKWTNLPKSFRYIERFSFVSTTHNIRFDASFVRENKKDVRGQYIRATTFTGAAISSQPVHYEMEVEALRGAVQKSMITGIVSVLRGLQKCYVLVRRSIRDSVLSQMAVLTGAQKKQFPGPQPFTLLKENFGIEEQADTPNIRTGDYNVTDKADGLRCLLLVSKTGHIHLIDRQMNVYGTDRRMDEVGTTEWAGCLLDGEWVTQDADGKPMSRYYAFDIYNGKRGEDVSTRPFAVRSSVAASRLSAMSEAVAAISDAKYTLASIPKSSSMSIHMKTFQIPDDPTDIKGIFDAAATVLDRVKASRPYHTDGLIFTPNNSPLPKNTNRWPAQLKWKPASENSVDFLVRIEKERSDGKPTGVELISTRLREDTNQIVRNKTLRLFVGSWNAVDPAYADPRDTILNNKTEEVVGRRRANEKGYRPVEFRPTPPDPMASVSYVAINAGATDAAGAAPAAQALKSLDDNIYCENTQDIIQNNTIVEMIYRPENPAGWRWIPMRVRWDKTEQFSRGEILGTLNGENTANDVWKSIHNPITEYMIRNGAVSEERVTEGTDASTTAYYQRKASQRDLHKVRGLAEFHNEYIKRNILLSKTIQKGSALMDMSSGQGGDIHKWIDYGVGWVLGADLALTGIIDPVDGAYARYLKRIVQAKGISNIPKMLFVQANSAIRYADGSAGQTPLDRTILRTLWGENEPTVPSFVHEFKGKASYGFDVVSLMFSLHYFFKDTFTLDGLLQNICETLKVGGYFIGCCFDGNAVANLLRDIPLGGIKRGNEDGVDIWSITKKYDDMTGVLPANESCLGRAIDVNFISIGDPKTEYLVSFDYFTARLAEIGLEPLNAEELENVGLKHSSNMFSESYEMSVRGGRTFPMSPTVKAFSFLNRWFIFRRKTTGTDVPVGEFIPIAAPVAAAPTTVPAPAPAKEEEAEDEAEEEAEEEEAEEEEAEEEAEEEEVEEEEAEEEKAEPELQIATGPIYQFYHKSAAKDELKVGDKHWRRYLSTYAPYKYRDPKNPAIVYSSLEAAIGAAKYTVASNKPELGPQIFSETGNIHQEFELKKREKGGELSPDDAFEFMEDEGNKMRNAQKPQEMRKAGAKFDPEAWSEARERILTEYVRQRYEGDEKFRKIMDAIAAQKARLVYYIAGGGNELSGVIKGDSIEGENLYGRALLYQVGLKY